MRMRVKEVKGRGFKPQKRSQRSNWALGSNFRLFGSVLVKFPPLPSVSIGKGDVPASTLHISCKLPKMDWFIYRLAGRPVHTTHFVSFQVVCQTLIICTYQINGIQAFYDLPSQHVVPPFSLASTLFVLNDDIRGIEQKKNYRSKNLFKF